MPDSAVNEEARAVAEELGLPRWWLNNQASAYLAPGGDIAASRVFDHPEEEVPPRARLILEAIFDRERS